MNPKQQTAISHKLVALNFLLLETLDSLKPSTPEMLEYKNSLIKIGEMLINEIADTPAIQRTTYFSNLSNQVDTVIRRNLNVEL